MIVTAFIIARLANQPWQIRALDETQLERLDRLSASVQQALNRNADLQRVMRRVGGRGRWQLMAQNTKTNELVLGFPPMFLRQGERLKDFENTFADLKDAEAPVLLRARNIEFYGPTTLTNQGQEYQLYVGRLLRFEQRPVFALSIAFVVALLIGSLACIGIAYTITKPIKHLSKISRDIAKRRQKAYTDDSIVDPSSNPQLDITNDFNHRKDELGRLHKDMLNMAAKLSKSLMQQKALMANISHELRTPLTRLQLATAMLETKEDKQKQYLTRIEKEITLMDSLIGQTLQLAKLDDDNQMQWLQREVCELKSVVQPVLEDLQFEAQAKKVQLSCSTLPQVELLMVRSSVVSAIENVTRNAIKFCDNRVSLKFNLAEFEVSEHSIKDAGIQIPDHKVSQALQIEVEDDGEGISTDQMTTIFEPFYRATTGKHYQGTGLGLAIAKAAVDLHFGKIEATSSKLGGLQINMYFPIFERK